MSQVSIIIVNYNVKYFLEQCLVSIAKAMDGLNVEVIVVDNASSDGSVESIQHQFPWVRLIANSENVGFARANNQGIAKATGEFVLLLNPDTVVQEDTLTACLEFMEHQPKAGALGVRMIDGTGKFLPESKRSFPGPRVAFYKLFGLAALFPNSKEFGKYHLGYLSEHENHEVDVLSGAFMFLRKAVLDQIEGLDERFFMYGEDIDLSYQIQQAGYKNYYTPNTSIIHYKGESTKKGSLNYVKHFYQAMILFAKKHFSGSKAGVFVLIMQLAIGFRAGMAVIHRLIQPIGLLLVDTLLGYAALFGMKTFWEMVNAGIGKYPKALWLINFPLYLLVWLIAVYLRGGYDKPYKTYKLLSGMIWGTVFVGAIYAFLPNHLRFSRALIVLGAASLYLTWFLTRWLYTLLKTGQTSLNYDVPKRLIVVSSKAPGETILAKLSELHIPFELLGWVKPESSYSEEYFGSLEDIEAIVEAVNPNEVIVNEDEVDYERTMALMTAFAEKPLTVKIASPSGGRIIGSTSKNVLGDLYAEEMRLHINDAGVKRKKRLMAFLTSVAMLLGSPILIWCYKNKSQFLSNVFQLLVGRVDVVSYNQGFGSDTTELPKMKPGILHTLTGVPLKLHTAPLAARFNYNYAKNYTTHTDWELLVKYWRHLDGIPQK